MQPYFVLGIDRRVFIAQAMSMTSWQSVVFGFAKMLFIYIFIIGSPEALPILCVRCARWERERVTERVRRKWRHLSSAEIDDGFCTFPCQNVHLSIGEEFCTFPCQQCAPLSRTPLLNGAEFTLPLHVNTLHCSKQFAFFVASVKWRDRGSKHRNKRSNFCLHRPSSHRKKWIKLIPKTIGNRKRDCAWGCARGINTTWENLQIEKHK